MANRCSTTIQIKPYKEGEAERVGKEICKWRAERFNNELASAALHANFALWAGLNPNDFDVRGEVVTAYFNKDEIAIVADDAWTPKLVVWFAICNRLFGVDQYQFTYTAHECGFNIFSTNDVDLIGTFYWDNMNNNDKIARLVGDEYFSVSQDDTRSVLLELFPEADRNASLDELLKLYEDSEFKKECVIHQWDKASELEGGNI